MELQERHAGPRAYGPPSPFQGNAERNSARGGGRGGGRVGRRGGAWVPAGPPALLSPPGVLCSLLRPGEVTAWPPQFYAQGFRKLQMDKQPSPFPHPSPSPRRPLPPAHTHTLSLSGSNPPVPFSPRPHSVCLSSSLTCWAVFSLHPTPALGLLLFLCLFLLRPHLLRIRLFPPVFKLSPSSSPFPHLLPACLSVCSSPSVALVLGF